METGAVSFHKPHEVMFIKIEKIPEIVKALSKTKLEEYPDLKKSLEAHKADIDAIEREANRLLIAEQKADKAKILAKEKEKNDFFAM